MHWKMTEKKLFYLSLSTCVEAPENTTEDQLVRLALEQFAVTDPPPTAEVFFIEDVKEEAAP